MRSVVCGAVLGGPRQAHGECHLLVLLLFIPACWPRARGSKLAGNWVRKSEGRKGLAEWFKVLLWAWSQRDNAWSYRPCLGCEEPASLSEAVCLLMWRPLVEGLALPEVVLWYGWAAPCPEGAAPLTELVTGAAVAPVITAVGVWFSRRWSSTLLIWASCIVVSLSCCDSSSIHCLSQTDCSSCWPTLVDSMAKECSVEPLVVMIVIAATGGAIALCAVLTGGLRCCSDGARGA